MAEAIGEEYKSSLADLNFNSKPHINMLTMVAEDNIKCAPQIVQAIVNHIHSVPADLKLPGLYLVDSIIKNVGKQYLTLFSQNLVNLFSSVFEKVEENTRSLLYKLRQTWNDILPNKILYAVDLRVKKVDPAWPITAKPPAQSIHINPKFLDSPQETQPPEKPVPPVILKKEEDKIKQQQNEVLKQLLVKQEQLRLLEKKKLEITLMQKMAKSTTLKSFQAPNPIMHPIPDPRTVGKTNPRFPLNQRDPRLQKANPPPAFKPKMLPSAPHLQVIAKTSPSTVSIPSVAVVPTQKISLPPSHVPKETPRLANSVPLRPTGKIDTKQDSQLAQKKHGSKKSEASSPVKNSKNEKTNLLKNKNVISKEKHEAEKTFQEEKTQAVGKPEPDKPAKISKTSKEKDKSPKSTKKKSSNTFEDKQTSPRITRSHTKAECPKKQLLQNNSRSPNPVPEKPKVAEKENRKNMEDKPKPQPVDKPFEKRESAIDVDLRLPQPSDEVTRTGKRDSRALQNENGKENEIQSPPSKKARESPVEESDDTRESHDLFGSEDQDYRQHGTDHKESNHKGWAQYKAVHPDEFKSPLRPSRENMPGKIKSRQFQRPDSGDKFYPVEYDRLGRPRLPRGRFNARYGDRHGHFMRGPGNRFDPLHPSEQYMKHRVASMVLREPDAILEEAKAKFCLGRLSERDYHELCRELKIMCEHKDYWLSHEEAYRIEHGDRFGMENVSEFQDMQMPRNNQEPEQFFPPLKVQGPMHPPPSTRNFKLDNRMRRIHFIDEKAIVVMDNNEPHELTFKGDSRNVFVEGLPEPLNLSFDGQSVEFEVEGKRHIMRFGTPSREIYINNYPYEAKFGGPPFAAMLEDGRIYRIRIGGPPPQVVVGEKPEFELFAKFHGKPFGPPAESQALSSEWRKQAPNKDLPYDVDMRMNTEATNMPPLEFEHNDDSMKDVDWRQLPSERENNTRSEMWDHRSQPNRFENWNEGDTSLSDRPYADRQNIQGPSDWSNSPDYRSDCLPPGPRWDGPSPRHPMNGSPQNTPPHQKEWEPYDPASQKNWPPNEYNRDSRIPPRHGQVYNNRRNSPYHFDEKGPKFFDGPRSNLPPNAPQRHRPPFHDQHWSRPRFSGPQYGPWVRPKFKEKGAASQENRAALLPPPLPPFEIKTASNQPALQPPPRFPGLDPGKESQPPSTDPAPMTPAETNQPPPVNTDSGTSSESKSETTATVPETVSTAPQLNIDVTTLFQKLVAAGIIGSKRNQPADVDKAPEEEVKKENIPEEEPLPTIELSSESLRKHYPGVMSALYKGSQCASCGMRFKEMQSERYSRHLDWHFRMNRREKDGVKKAFSRRWYYEVEDWAQYEEFEDFEERAPSYFELQADGGQGAPAETVEVPSVPALGQETEICVVCEEPFQLFWVEEEEEWHLRDAVRYDDQAYHPACYEDFKKAIEAPEVLPDAPKEETEATKEEKVEEEIAIDTETTTEVEVKEEKEDEIKEVEDKIAESTLEDDDTKDPTTVVIKEEPMEETEEPVEEILEGKPGEEEIIGLISESDMEAESEAPKVESKMVVLQSGGIVVKVKAESIQPQSPSVPSSDKEAAAKEPNEEEEIEEFRPPTPDPRFQVLPPVKKGTELSGLCRIM